MCCFFLLSILVRSICKRAYTLTLQNVGKTSKEGRVNCNSLFCFPFCNLTKKHEKKIILLRMQTELPYWLIVGLTTCSQRL
ncbi:hypothetical protein BC941DRAFT_435411 [Chlamydoabsidia padenii]|nr:hypothetical protein BC941DRAFT_435411 [Chlamydoabsidia padenii]